MVRGLHVNLEALLLRTDGNLQQCVREKNALQLPNATLLVELATAQGLVRQQQQVEQDVRVQVQQWTTKKVPLRLLTGREPPRLDQINTS